MDRPDRRAPGRRHAEGSDYIKIFQDDGSRPGRAPTLAAFPPARLAQVVAAAKRTGKLAIVHIQQLEAARAVIADGADAIAHVFEDAPADAPFLALMKARHATLITTLSVFAGAAGSGEAAKLAADPAIAPWLSAAQRGMLANDFPLHSPETLPMTLDNVRRIHAAGIPILAGTDSPNPQTAHGVTLHEELALLVRAGSTPAEALSAATVGPARFFGTPDRGRIAVGERADLLLVDGDPTVDITATRRIAGIWKNGYPVDRAAPAATATPSR